MAAIRVSLLLVSLGMLSPAHGFWFTTSRAKSQAPQWFGIRDYGAAAQSAYSYDTSGGVTVAVPVAVPLSPQSVQMSPPYPGLGAVELVPCLCPIAKNPESIKPLPVNAAPAPPVPVAMPPMQPMQQNHHHHQQHEKAEEH
ncbi:uncharacterized protein LOC117639875 [Thrips palmi]|uniref:Uncharacterized protein LOC117639875 n=1 Tax=Thrips palmi TaxID=161013 RepID=A0A6P8XXA2_THRPL|nr:uncharacterized protein LOC117639875 [Thrips palmi]